MAEIINLRSTRKAVARDIMRAKATENAAKHGRSKALKALEVARAEKAMRNLDGAKRETE